MTTMTTRLPFAPEPIPALQACVPAALADLIDPGECASRGYAPGLDRTHVFDFEDGLRLIISRDNLGSREAIHFSASVEPESFFATGLDRGEAGYRELCREAWKRARRLLGMAPSPTRDPDLDTENPHWYLTTVTLD